MKLTDFERELRKAGWELHREDGNHSIYERNGIKWPVKRHREIDEPTIKSWRKLNEEMDREEKNR